MILDPIQVEPISLTSILDKDSERNSGLLEGFNAGCLQGR